MTRILVLYYSMYGHVEILAKAVAEGARSVEGVEVTIKRVPELMPEEVARKAGAKLDQEASLRQLMSCLITMRLSLVPRPDSGTCARRCAISWIKRGNIG